ncbi:hypothetical protein ACFSKN_03030 [Mariniflexile gromovii]
MKKSLFTLVLGLLVSIATMAQSNNDRRAERITQQALTKIEASLTLKEEEKKTFEALKKESLFKHFEIADEYKTKDPEMFKQKIKENNEKFNESMFKAFGKARAREIMATMKN